jgi:hypothetical protein
MTANTVGRNLKGVFKKSDSPANERDFPQWHILVFEMAVPGKGHKDVGNKKKNNCQHEEGPYPIPKSDADSSGVPQTRQITAEQSPQVRGSVTCRAQLGQYSASFACCEFTGSAIARSR